MRKQPNSFAGKKSQQPDPFAAIPIIAEGVAAGLDSQQLLQLKRELPPKGRFGALMARWFKFKSLTRVNLDDKGTFFWKQIDGNRSLREIAGILKREYSLSEKESREATVVFTKMLMLRHLILLKVEERRKTKRTETTKRT